MLTFSMTSVSVFDRLFWDLLLAVAFSLHRVVVTARIATQLIGQDCLPPSNVVKLLPLAADAGWWPRCWQPPDVQGGSRARPRYDDWVPSAQNQRNDWGACWTLPLGFLTWEETLTLLLFREVTFNLNTCHHLEIIVRTTDVYFRF